MNNELRKRLRTAADQHMNGIQHDTLGRAVEELQRLHPECQITTIPVTTDIGGYHVGYRFRVTLDDGSEDAGSFTVPIDPDSVYAITQP
jgi:hypothetical protein